MIKNSGVDSLKEGEFKKGIVSCLINNPCYIDPRSPGVPIPPLTLIRLKARNDTIFLSSGKSLCRTRLIMSTNHMG